MPPLLADPRSRAHQRRQRADALLVRGSVLERFALRVDGQELMHSNSHGSEEKLAVHGCAGLAARTEARGSWSAVSAWDSPPAPRSTASPPTPRWWSWRRSPQVIAWNRDPGAPRPAGRDAARRSAPVGRRRGRGRRDRTSGCGHDRGARFDAILLDVDNGPTALSTFTNRRLYTVAGLAQRAPGAAQRRRPGGLVDVRRRAGSPPACARRASPRARCACWRATAPAAATSCGWRGRPATISRAWAATSRAGRDTERPPPSCSRPGAARASCVPALAEEAHATDHQAPDLGEAVDAPAAAAREIDGRVHVELEPVVLLAKQDAAEIGGQLIDVGSRRLSPATENWSWATP